MAQQIIDLGNTKNVSFNGQEVKILKLNNDTVWEKQKTFDEYSWAEINEIAQAGNAQKYFSVGYEKDITLTTGETITVIILGFNYDDLASGGKAPITIGMKGCLNTLYPMGTVSAGIEWDASKMRTEILPTIFQQLPTDLQNVIKTVTKKTLNIQTDDKLWLLDLNEMQGSTNVERYEYWETIKNGTLASDRIKYSNSNAVSWWTRSVFNLFGVVRSNYYINNLGAIIQSSSSENFGVSFCFCI